MDIIANSLEVTIAAALDQRGFVSAGEDMSGEFVAAVEAVCIGAQEPAHAIDQIGFGRFNDEVKMVAHEAIGMHLPAGLQAGFSECLEEILAVNIVEIDVFAPIAAAQHVVNGTGILDPDLTWHGRRMMGDGARKQDQTKLWVDPEFRPAPHRSRP